MPNKIFFGPIVSVLIVLLPAQSVGQDNRKADAENFPPVLKIYSSSSREAYIYRLMNMFRAGAGADQVLDQVDIDLSRMRAQAQARAQKLMKLLIHDLNGDGIVTDREIEQVLNANNSSTHARTRQRRELSSFDSNGDGRVTIAEALAKTTKTSRRLNLLLATSTPLEQLFKLDPNGDGRLTADEVETIARKTFARFDLDDNGLLSDSEKRTWRQATRANRKRTQPSRDAIAKCNLPPASASAKVLLLNAYEAGALSNVTVAGQDKKTETSTFFIEPGSTPLYIVATSFSTNIWHFTGATERITRVVAIPSRRLRNYSAIGVVGIARDRITFLEGGACMSYFKSGRSGAARQAKAIVEGILKHPVYRIVSQYKLPGAILPSGVKHGFKVGDAVRRIIRFDDTHIVNLSSHGAWPSDSSNAYPDPPRTEYDSNGRLILGGNIYRFSEWGFITLDPSTVVSPGRVERYDVLPGFQGLRQLSKEGKIESLHDGFYLIKKPIPRIPAGLHKYKFMLGKGVPAPAGGSGRYCLISEETGKPIGHNSAARCR